MLQSGLSNTNDRSDYPLLPPPPARTIYIDRLMMTQVDNMLAVMEQLLLVPKESRLDALKKRQADVTERIERLRRLKEEMEVEMEKMLRGGGLLEAKREDTTASAKEKST